MDKCSECGTVAAQLFGVDDMCGDCYRREMNGRDRYGLDPYAPDID